MELIVAIDSPIRVRSDLNRRQALQLDAIAVASNVIDLLYRRLLESIERFGDDDAVELLLPDAWGMIDWVHRVDGLIMGCVGLSKRLDFVVKYRNASSLVETLRHSVQHLEGTIPTLESSGRSPWGHVVWTVDEGRPEGHHRFQRKAAGSSLIGGVDQSYALGTPLPPRTPIDYVSLFSGDGEAEIGLTGQHEALQRFIPRLEAAISASGPPGLDGILRIRG